MSNSHFVNLNATNAGIGELRTIIEDARKRVRSLQQRTNSYSSMKFIVLIKANKMCCYLV